MWLHQHHQSLLTTIFGLAQAKEDLSHFNFLWGDDLRSSASTYTNNATIKDYHETLAKLPSEGRKAAFKKITTLTFIMANLNHGSRTQISLQVNFRGIMGLSHALALLLKVLKPFLWIWTHFYLSKWTTMRPKSILQKGHYLEWVMVSSIHRHSFHHYTMPLLYNGKRKKTKMRNIIPNCSHIVTKFISRFC